MKHFETLWEEAEKITESLPTESSKSIINLIKEQLDIYLAVDGQASSDKEFIHFSKTKTFGRILLNLTHLARIDAVNSYAALAGAIDSAKIAVLSNVNAVSKKL